MKELEIANLINNMLLEEMPEYKVSAKQFKNNENEQFRLFRSLVNLREPKEASEEFLNLQNEYLKLLLDKRGVVHFSSLSQKTNGIYLYKGDITTLECDAIVNAANSQMLGCFCPCHGCIDNAIHTFSGVQLRLACYELMKKQGHLEEEGKAKITRAFNLPSKYVIHTVGPIVENKPTQQDKDTLKSCYKSCLEIADANNLKSIAFCCISTGEFHFPNEEAAKIAVETVKKYLEQTSSKLEVIFNVFKDVDYQLYRNIFFKA